MSNLFMFCCGLVLVHFSKILQAYSTDTMITSVPFCGIWMIPRQTSVKNSNYSHNKMKDEESM